jgi:hypothetical protein
MGGAFKAAADWDEITIEDRASHLVTTRKRILNMMNAKMATTQVRERMAKSCFPREVTASDE